MTVCTASENTSLVTISFSGNTGTLTGGSSTGSADIWADIYGIYDYEGNEGEIGTETTYSEVYEQTPTYVGYISQISAMQLTSSTNPSCPVGQAGYQRVVTLQLFDQYSIPITESGLTVGDTLTIGTPNALGISGTKTGSATTDGGQWPDTYSVCSAVCPTSGGQTDATQSWTVNGTAITGTNSIVYECSSITISGS